ncbi:MAG: hypothetical protein EBS85_02315 [Micrococcales bacterium]|nr:hypothetical protein [Actinomycetota bacterium]NCA07551.1 hypothetical protein [Micrococcales bacterium]
MSVFVVTYAYSADPIELNQVRPTHRIWLQEQFDSGRLLASGPMVDRQAGLLIWSSSSIEELNTLLDQDPFELAGMIGERTIEEWNPVFGPFSN